jgi:DNA-binding NtrC family response regulator
MKVRMTVSLEGQLVDKLSEFARRTGLSNSGVLNLCLRYALPRLESGQLLDIAPTPRPAKVLSILLVEDSEGDAQLLLRALRRADYEPDVEIVQTEKQMAEALRKRHWDLVLSDWVLPEFSGLEALRLHRNSGLRIPFIIVSGRIGIEAAVEAMRAGADDYVLKDQLEKLVPAVERALTVRSQVAESVTSSGPERPLQPEKSRAKKAHSPVRG